MTDALTQELTRNMAMEQSVDPFGNKWGVAHEQHTALYYIGKIVKDDFNEAREVAKKPLKYPSDGLAGHFTKPELAEKEIKSYLRSAWDMSDEKAKKAAGKERAKAAREEVENGSTEN